MPTIARCADEWLVRLLIRKAIIDPVAGENILKDAPPYASQELLRRGTITKEQLAGALQSQYGIRFFEPKRDSLDKMAISLIPENLCQRHTLFPLRVDGEIIEVLMANPLDGTALDAVSAASGRRAIAVYGLPDKIEELIAAGYGSDTAIFDLIKKLPEEAAVEVLGAEKDDDGPGRAVGMPVIRRQPFTFGNTAIAKLVHEHNRWRLRTLNDQCHLHDAHTGDR